MLAGANGAHRLDFLAWPGLVVLGPCVTISTFGSAAWLDLASVPTL